MNELIDGRRPIASREKKWSKLLAAWLSKKNVSPNFISVLSIVFSMIAFFAFYFDNNASTYHFLWLILAIIGIQGRLIMNLLDGMVAIEYNKKTYVGALYNEVPDRISDSFIIIGVGFLVKNYPYGMDLAYIAAILAVITAYIRILGASLDCGHYFTGPMAKQHRMLLITAGCLIGIWYLPIFYYMMIIMNIGLIITCFIRLQKIYNCLNSKS
jgi:phosphatidylglycerophosphate synthase